MYRAIYVLPSHKLILTLKILLEGIKGKFISLKFAFTFKNVHQHKFKGVHIN